MAYHFSANQFDKQYSAKRLNNWELPKYYPNKPRTRKGSTKIIANDNGHIIDEKLKTDKNPWGNFRGTYQLPRKITKQFVAEYNACLTKRDKWKAFQTPSACPDPNNNSNFNSKDCPNKCETSCRILSDAKRLELKQKPLDLEYRPGDYTPTEQQLPTSYKDIIQQKLEKERSSYVDDELKLKKLTLKDEHSCTLNNKDDKPFTPCLPPASNSSTNDHNVASLNPQLNDYPLANTTSSTSLLPKTAALTTSLSPAIRDYQFDNVNSSLDLLNNMPNHSITEKPNERCPSPITPAFANFELAKRMHHENLDHQPLPDCVADLAYRKQQITGGFPGLALDIPPVATGVGIKMHNAGPTHCTKMKVYRPKTCGVVPKPFNGDLYRSVSAAPNKKMGAMDLAICWDYRPNNPADEPQPPRHIDGSNESAGPAVFTCVKTPREDAAPNNTGRSAGVFNSTIGEPDFFDKDILRRKTDFTGRNIEFDDPCKCDLSTLPAPPRTRARSVTRDTSFDFNATSMPSRYDKQYQSSPNIAEQPAYKAMRNKYLENTAAGANFDFKPNRLSCKRDNTSFLRRARNRLCHKIAPEPVCCRSMPMERPMHCKAAFRAGVPRFNAAGGMISTDSGCSVGQNRVLVIPRPRNPYTKKNYDIDTLVPPFRSMAGGAGEGGYPEHWRLASVYQHAYKPPEQRRKPLLQTVYK